MEKTYPELWEQGDACEEIKNPPSNRHECAVLLVEEIKSILLNHNEWREVINFEKDKMTVFVRDATKSAYPNTIKLHTSSFYRLVTSNLKAELLI
tara:strand:- start:634 stop:918 length:285 start_codon:yes stop_codon:yes gene_type:complete